MYSIRTIVSVAAVLLASVVVNAAPLPMPAVSAHHVKPGGVFMAKPVNFDPPLPGHSTTTGARNHPVIALDHPSHDGWVPVAVVSHNHPEHMQGAIHEAHHYDHNTHAAGVGSFSAGSQIAVGHPTHVHIDDMHHVSPDSNLPHQLHPTDTGNLHHAVNHETGFVPSNEKHRTPSPHTPPWRKQ
ncbi:hypothetical protein CPB84DRAFT_1848529 [Gymnopilus junonius]|uniref:Secreted protein n=1 Tax=Gymnopilus junonius TaxID=109634 RepID=A0A9P5TMD2_GYMJU|nr:hypothetical protein CPB84DRAFT_1848529 [Gymnopilus junonius]